MRRTTFETFAIATLAVLVILLVAASAEAAPKPKFPVCHQYGTPAQKTLLLPYEGVMGHINGHGDFACTCPVADFWIDADGSATPGRGLPGAIDPYICGRLTSWPTGGLYVEGIDWFDNDGTCTWTFGDDLHVEGPAHPTAFRDGFHDANPNFVDPLVLDLDGSLFDGQQVDVDLETGTVFTSCPGVDPHLKFFDANANGVWDDGEDIIFDTNNDGVFN